METVTGSRLDLCAAFDTAVYVVRLRRRLRELRPRGRHLRPDDLIWLRQQRSDAAFLVASELVRGVM